jgi:3-deoxy-manno-octulosonate cytidylyltransferase (CMP-KDO synthetase)
VAEVAALPEFQEYDTVLNVQGDEPFLPASAVWGSLERVERGDAIGTAATALGTDASNPARVKVLIDGRGRAVSFRRYQTAASPCSHRLVCLQHVGVYAYTRRALNQWVSVPAVPEEIAERLEQLRPLAHGMDIGVAVINEPAARGIDTEADLAWACTHATTLSEKGV